MFISLARSLFETPPFWAPTKSKWNIRWTRERRRSPLASGLAQRWVQGLGLQRVGLQTDGCTQQGHRWHVRLAGDAESQEQSVGSPY